MIKKNGGMFGRNPTFNDVVIEGTLDTPLGAINTGAALVADTDGALTANSDANVATQKAVKTYVDGKVTGLFDLKGSIDCSGNPDYPAASKADAYVVSVAGKIGGASGVAVEVGDAIIASADNAGGTQAAVGSSWFILEHNINGALIASNNLSDLANAATARTNLGLGSAATTASTDYAPAAQGVTNGNSHDHNGGDGGQIAYSSLSGLPTLGTAAAASTTDFAPSSKGVTNGDSHDHNGGDGGQIAYSSLSGLPTLPQEFVYRTVMLFGFGGEVATLCDGGGAGGAGPETLTMPSVMFVQGGGNQYDFPALTGHKRCVRYHVKFKRLNYAVGVTKTLTFTHNKNSSWSTSVTASGVGNSAYTNYVSTALKEGTGSPPIFYYDGAWTIDLTINSSQYDGDDVQGVWIDYVYQRSA